MMQVTQTFTTRTVVSVIIYFTFLLDNILLTVIVPILPDYLMQINDKFQSNSLPDSVVYKNFTFHYLPEVLTQDLQQTTGQKLAHNSTIVEKYSNVENENAAIGILLAIKAIVQIFCNPLIGNSTKYIGYSVPITCGTICILLATLVFCVGNSYGMLLLARMIHGVGSACVNVCGMSLIAQVISSNLF
jgi:MFS transporter, DHA1 family, solute carrier family 18 (vesicular amine transporter), member 1/2